MLDTKLLKFFEKISTKDLSRLEYSKILFCGSENKNFSISGYFICGEQITEKKEEKNKKPTKKKYNFLKFRCFEYLGSPVVKFLFFFSFCLSFFSLTFFLFFFLIFFLFFFSLFPSLFFSLSFLSLSLSLFFSSSLSLSQVVLLFSFFLFLFPSFSFSFSLSFSFFFSSFFILYIAKN